MQRRFLKDIARVLGLMLDQDISVSSCQIDSRLIGIGDLFFALKGKRADGHAFLAEAKNRGAVAAVVEKGYQGPDFGMALLGVEDVQIALQLLAAQDLEASQARVVGITGSVGKTTTKEFLAEILQGKYRVGKTPGNYNTCLSLPLSILNRQGAEEVLVLEMGMSQPGDLSRLVQIAPPEVAVVTKVALAHAAFFPRGVDQIAEGKAQIFLSSKLRAAIYEKKLSVYPCFANAPADRFAFSLEERDADYFLSFAEGRYSVDERGVRAYRLDLPFQESHLLSNFLAAASAARQMGMEWDEIHSRIPYLKTPRMRFERLEKNGVLFINDAYNANPESMRAAFLGLPAPREGGKRIGVLGSMAELGAFSEAAHREIGRMARECFDFLLVSGEEAVPMLESFLEVKKPGEFFQDLATLADRLRSLVSQGDVVLVKGSRMMNMETLFSMLEI